MIPHMNGLLVFIEMKQKKKFKMTDSKNVLEKKNHFFYSSKLASYFGFIDERIVLLTKNNL